MSGFPILRRLLAVQDRAEAQETARRFPPLELRFALEYSAPPDLAAERSAIAQLLESEEFTLQPLFVGDEPELARILLLRFPGIERTLSPETLFSIAYDLADARALVRAEPDLGSRIFADPPPLADELRPEAADALGTLCWVDADTPADKRWALETMGVLRAWARFPSRGKGILIGQPDTGIAEHQEVDRAALDLDRAADILDGDKDPTDPLIPGTANPGHGTGTASVVISREAGVMVGSAPEATLVPIRCTTDVKIFDGTPVAAAIEHATRVECDVITMSLGGPPSLAVHAAVRNAVAKGVIVLAAAGNCVRIVVYPARYDAVIAVAGVNVADQPWRGSSRGRAIDISAPAELVWRAQRNSKEDPTTTVSGGQGTSFAVALIAGVAALWLAHHGRDQVRAEANRRGVRVQTLFKTALQATARQPALWDADDFGPGIVDADQLLGLPLNLIPAAAPEAAPREDEHILDVLDEIAGVKTRDPTFDWKRYGLEVANIVYDDARFGRGGTTLTRAPGVRPSPELATVAQRSPDPRLREIAAGQARRAVGVSQPRTRNFSAPPSLIQILGRPRTQGLESAGSVTLEAARRNLHEGGIRNLLDEAERRLQAIEQRERESDPLASRMRRQFLEQGEEALHRIVREGAPRVGGPQRAVLEALVSLTDRPAIRVENGTIDVNHPELGPWRGAFALAQLEIEAVFRSVGRIDVGGEHVGTAFLVGDGVVMTNRHVIEAFAAPVPKRRDPKEWVLESDQVVVDFSDDATGGAKTFRVKSIIAAGKEPITDLPIDFTKLDMALLEVETSNAAGKLPPPVPLLANAQRAEHERQIFTVGYPAKPQILPTDPAGALRMDVVARLRAIFRLKYGVKYFSPGVVSTTLGHVEGDLRTWVFNHDATTLAGNSGSAAVDFADPIAVIGLHFAGDWLRANHAHAIAAVKASKEMPRLDGLDWV
jgi:serine protease